jgi:DNA-directed RNA polymerase specialized sigma24 family protein
MREIDYGRPGRHGPVEVEHSLVRAITEDESRLAALRTRDRQAFEELCRECYPSVTHFLSLVIPEVPTEDVCIDAFTKAWLHVEGSPRNIAAHTWMFSIVYRQAHERTGVREAVCLSSVTNRSDPNHPEMPRIPRLFDPRDVLRDLAWEPRVVAALVYGMCFSMNTICWITGMTDREVTEYLESARHRFRLRERSVRARAPILDSTVELIVHERSKEQ